METGEYKFKGQGIIITQKGTLEDNIVISEEEILKEINRRKNKPKKQKRKKIEIIDKFYATTQFDGKPIYKTEKMEQILKQDELNLQNKFKKEHNKEAHSQVNNINKKYFDSQYEQYQESYSKSQLNSKISNINNNTNKDINIRYKDLGDKRYNYDKALYEKFDSDDPCCRPSGSSRPITYINTCDYIFDEPNNNIFNKYLYDRWMTTLILNCFIILLDLFLVISGFMLYKDQKEVVDFMNNSKPNIIQIDTNRNILDILNINDNIDKNKIDENEEDQKEEKNDIINENVLEVEQQINNKNDLNDFILLKNSNINNINNDNNKNNENNLENEHKVEEEINNKENINENKEENNNIDQNLNFEAKKENVEEKEIGEIDEINDVLPENIKKNENLCKIVISLSSDEMNILNNSGNEIDNILSNLEKSFNCCLFNSKYSVSF